MFEDAAVLSVCIRHPVCFSSRALERWIYVAHVCTRLSPTWPELMTKGLYTPRFVSENSLNVELGDRPARVYPLFKPSVVYASETFVRVSSGSRTVQETEERRHLYSGFPSEGKIRRGGGEEEKGGR